MSRINDRSGDRRAQEARLQERRNQDRLQRQRTAQTTAFDAALQRQEESGRKQERPLRTPPRFGEQLATKQQGTKLGPPIDAKPADETAADVAMLLEGELPETEGRQFEQLRQKGQRFNEGLAERKPGQAALARAESQFLSSRTDAERASAERQPDAKSEDISHDIVTGGGRKNAPVQRRGEGQGGGSTGQDSNRGGGNEKQESTFRMPPAALMAPPPVARPKEGAAAGRFQAITKEIVEKIVSRVLVGHNDQGVPEFRIDLKSSVLKGLTIKVSGGRGGRIRAVFSGTDREALKALEKTSSELVSALAARGLSLEAIEFEQE